MVKEIAGKWNKWNKVEQNIIRKIANILNQGYLIITSKVGLFLSKVVHMNIIQSYSYLQRKWNTISVEKGIIGKNIFSNSQTFNSIISIHRRSIHE